MKRSILTVSAVVLIGTAAYSQSAIDAYRLSQPDLKGTARYMSMAGAFGALGGDLSSLSHNPAGIGVYRNSDIGFTLDLDLQHSESGSGIYKTGIDQTKFLLNNIGFVYTLKLPSASCPNINFGFTYNKNASFNRRYRGTIGLNSSLSNYMAGIANINGYTEEQLGGEDAYNPYEGYGASWLPILGYQSGLIFGTTNQQGATSYLGEWDGTTSGTGYFDVQESGGIDSYNIALGGNISNVVFWGMDFDITHINYNLTPTWTEDLSSARVLNENGQFENMDDAWTMSNYYNCSGTGFNFKLGFIVKPIQEFRLGFSFETPTWYGLTETFSANIYNHYYPDLSNSTNGGVPGYNTVNFRTPWKLNASAAAVLFNKLIVSAEYEWTQFKGMRYSMPSPFGIDPWDPWDSYDPWYPWYSKTKGGYDPFISNDTFYYTNQEVQEYYQNTNTFRLGAEFRITPQFSVRAGYSFVSAPVKEDRNTWEIQTAGTIPNYRFDQTTNYVTCGLGYKIKSFYADLAYVWKNMKSTYHAFSPLYPDDSGYVTSFVPSPSSSLSLSNSQIVLTAGFKF